MRNIIFFFSTYYIFISFFTILAEESLIYYVGETKISLGFCEEYSLLEGSNEHIKELESRLESSQNIKVYQVSDSKLLVHSSDLQSKLNNNSLNLSSVAHQRTPLFQRSESPNEFVHFTNSLYFKIKSGINCQNFLDGINLEAEQSGDSVTINEISERLYTLSFNELKIPIIMDYVGQLQQKDEIEFVEPSLIFYSRHSYSRSRYVAEEDIYDIHKLQWGLKNIRRRDLGRGQRIKPFVDLGVEHVWESGIEGEGVIVAVIDDGVDFKHPELKDNIFPSSNEDDLKEYNVIGIGNLRDGKHGTHVAGIIASRRDKIGITGVAPKARIMPVKVSVGGNFVINRPDIFAKGIKLALIKGAKILNCSWGGPSNLVKEELIKAKDFGAVVVIAAGNEGRFLPETARLAKDHNHLITVTAINQYGEFKTFRSSDYDASWASNFGEGVTCCAPGIDIYTTDIAGVNGNNRGDYDMFKGTSAAVPFVSGSIALLLSKEPSLEPSQIKKRLISTAIHPNGSQTYTYTIEFGYGLVSSYGMIINQRRNRP